MDLAIEKQAARRADRAARCSSLHHRCFAALQEGAVGLADLCAADSPFTTRPLSAAQADQVVRWLLRVGLLRREVDGQGLTDRVRLTPLGRRVVASWPQGRCPPVSWAGALDQRAAALAQHLVMTGSSTPPLMILGTSSGVGKSLITAGLCRLLRRRGEQPVPFKGQNMSTQCLRG